ncbi:hypothetical protein GCM10010411_71530 [Actinomadura fulvescens]|uniref:Secreted protein n=1 Tax=Actinomadura fulvescens TaxID=46160 RepID=A0ABP6CSK5_9ACTN
MPSPSRTVAAGTSVTGTATSAASTTAETGRAAFLPAFRGTTAARSVRVARTNSWNEEVPAFPATEATNTAPIRQRQAKCTYSTRPDSRPVGVNRRYHPAKLGRHRNGHLQQ